MIELVILIAMLGVGVANLILTVHYWRLFLAKDKEEVKKEPRYLFYDGA